MKKNMWLGGAAGLVVLLLVAVFLSLKTPGNLSSAASGATPASRVPGAAPNAGNSSGPLAADGKPAIGTNSLAANSGSSAAGVASGPLGGPMPAPGQAGVQALSSVGLNTPIRINPIAIGKAGAPSMEDIQKRLIASTANGRQPSAREVDAVLADIQQNQGGNVVAGVDIQQLRNTLASADRMQQIALEMQTISANPRKEDVARLQALNAEMVRLQSVLMAGVPAAPKR